MNPERLGVYEIGKQISKQGMIFREQPTDDYGIDAQIETMENGYASGKLIAAQIKSGESFFHETTETSFVFRGKRKHYDYWLNHSLPVIIVLYNPITDESYWQVVNERNAMLTDKNWKIEVPKKNLLSEAKWELIKISDNQTEYQRKFNTFLLAKPWMNQIINGNKIILNVEEWINKSSGRGSFKMTTINDKGEKIQVFDHSFIGFGTQSYTEVFRKLFPWANFLVDTELYQEYDDEAIESENFEAASQTYYDSIGAELDLNICGWKMPDKYPSIEEWMLDVNNIRPYRLGAGEVAFYQLVLEINDIGKSFIQVDDFINNSSFYTLKL